MPSIADVVDAVASVLDGVTVLFGKEYQEDGQTAPPRVVFVPGEDRFLMPSIRDRNKYASKSVATRAVGLEARIWGQADPDADPVPTWPEYRATELLADRVVYAIKSVLAGAVEFEGGFFMDSSMGQAGRIYVLRIRVMLPVVETLDDAANETTSWTDVSSAADVPTPGIAAAVTTTVEIGEDGEETGSPSP